MFTELYVMNYGHGVLQQTSLVKQVLHLMFGDCMGLGCILYQQISSPVASLCISLPSGMQPEKYPPILFGSCVVRIPINL